MKKILPRLVCVFLTLSAFTAVEAASIITEADDDNGFSSTGGTDLPQGNLVRVGFFDISDAEIQQNQFDLTFLNSHFFEFGIAHIGDAYGVDGHFATPITR